MKTVVSAYAASPAHTTWDPVFEERFLAGLVDMDGVDALEIPWLGRLHPHDEDWFVTRLPPAELIVTALPWTVTRSTASAAYGLASSDENGRAAAVSDLARLHHDIRRLPTAPTVIMLHTAPRGGHGSVDSLRRSLATLASWDWCGAGLAIEHCDTAVPGHSYEKGFLGLDDELATAGVFEKVGIWMNWGRSAIELRDPGAVTAQIAAAASTGLLMGLTYSGASAAAGPYGPAWADTHLPFMETDAASGSLLNRSRAEEAAAAAPGVPWHGLKVSRNPRDESVADVLATVQANLEVMHAAGSAPVEERRPRSIPSGAMAP
ncbi:DUF4862 family protein [Leifsonia sp. NPDC058194]|uniref:DUF4862 family protein n=1 Tax=Leifsonia sp. NPDC058194 TaxID=3346374 RepID=UPI0036DB366E